MRAYIRADNFSELIRKATAFCGQSSDTPAILAIGKRSFTLIIEGEDRYGRFVCSLNNPSKKKFKITVSLEDLAEMKFGSQMIAIGSTSDQGCKAIRLHAGDISMLVEHYVRPFCKSQVYPHKSRPGLQLAIHRSAWLLINRALNYEGLKFEEHWSNGIDLHVHDGKLLAANVYSNSCAFIEVPLDDKRDLSVNIPAQNMGMISKIFKDGVILGVSGDRLRAFDQGVEVIVRRDGTNMPKTEYLSKIEYLKLEKPIFEFTLSAVKLREVDSFLFKRTGDSHNMRIKVLSKGEYLDFYYGEKMCCRLTPGGLMGDVDFTVPSHIWSQFVRKLKGEVHVRKLSECVWLNSGKQNFIFSDLKD